MSDVTSRSGLRSRVVAWGAGLGAALAPVLSMAAPSGGTGASMAAITEAATSFDASGTEAMVAIGGAIVTVAAVAIVFKWAKGMFFS